MIKCTGGRHVRTVQKDGSWPDTCQCGEIDYGDVERLEAPPPLGVHVRDGLGTKERLGGGDG